MSVGLCGKSCEFEYCELRAELGCPGCRMGPGNEMYGDCPIAACTRVKRVEGCESCPASLGCTETAVKELMPHRRKTAHAAKVAKAAVMEHRAPYMKKLFWMLFWLAILHGLDFYTFFDERDSLYRASQCLDDAIGFAMAMALVALAQEERSYLAPGCVLAGLSAHDFLLHLMTVGGAEPAWALLSALVIPYVEICMLHLMLTAHAEAVPDVDAALGEKWLKLRKWYVVCLLSLAVCNYIYIILPSVITAIVGVLAVVYLVLEILHLVYLYRMAKGYSRLCKGK